MKINKLDAGTSQLREVIKLFFEKRDPISVHTIAGAASHLLYNLCQHEGVENYVRGNPHIRADKKGQWISLVNEAQNFFKHADKDPNSDFDFNPKLTELLIFDACLSVEGLTGSMFSEAQVFTIWFSAKHPDMVLEGSFKDTIQAGLSKGIDVDDFQLMRMLLDSGHSEILSHKSPL